MHMDMIAELKSGDDPMPIDTHQAEHRDDPDIKKGINRLFRAACKLKASDVHLKADWPARFRVGGDIKKAHEAPLSNDEIERMIFEVTTPAAEAVLHRARGAGLRPPGAGAGPLPRERLPPARQDVGGGRGA